MQITDRSKDVIKSEASGSVRSTWRISRCRIRRSPKRRSSACPTRSGTKRPLLLVVLKEARARTRGPARFHARPGAKWWLPDDVVFRPNLRTPPPASSRSCDLESSTGTTGCPRPDGQGCSRPRRGHLPFPCPGVGHDGVQAGVARRPAQICRARRASATSRPDRPRGAAHPRSHRAAGHPLHVSSTSCTENPLPLPRLNWALGLPRPR